MLPSSIILHKRNPSSGITPSVSSLSAGELALNTADGKLFIKTIDNTIESFSNDRSRPFLLNESLSGVLPQYGNNTISQIFATILGGYNNDIIGGGSTVINGEDNDIAGDFSIIGSGLENKINSNGDYSFIAAGSGNLVNHSNVFVLGTGLSSHSSDFTYVNNLSSSGKIYANGVEITAGGSSGADTEVRSLTGNWESTYTTVQNNSANWDSAYSSGLDLEVRSLTGIWDSTFTTVSSNSANWNYQGTDIKELSGNWQSAYAYISANSVNLTATNIFVNNNLTVTDTVSAKHFQGTLIDWMTLVRGYKTTPTLLETIAGGEVYTYVYATTGADITYYRYIETNGSEDSFYGNFSSPTLSNLIATKAIIL
jgi:hypothetical protein